MPIFRNIVRINALKCYGKKTTPYTIVYRRIIIWTG